MSDVPSPLERANQVEVPVVTPSKIRRGVCLGGQIATFVVFLVITIACMGITAYIIVDSFNKNEAAPNWAIGLFTYLVGAWTPLHRITGTSANNNSQIVLGKTELRRLRVSPPSQEELTET